MRGVRRDESGTAARSPDSLGSRGTPRPGPGPAPPRVYRPRGPGPAPPSSSPEVWATFPDLGARPLLSAFARGAGRDQGKRGLRRLVGDETSLDELGDVLLVGLAAVVLASVSHLLPELAETGLVPQGLPD